MTALAALSVGLAATFAPRSFFDSYPFLRHWVDVLGPYNEHLTTDVGELQLAFGLVFAWAAARPRPALVVPVSLAWAIGQGAHAAFHLLHLQRFGLGDAIAQTASLLALVALPLLAGALVRPLSTA